MLVPPIGSSGCLLRWLRKADGGWLGPLGPTLHRMQRPRPNFMKIEVPATFFFFLSKKIPYEYSQLETVK